jgi:membrane-anchored glycerophosphoryl diester phosphodiesterase (GDPDase)
MKSVWKRWLVISKKITGVQATIVLFILYFLLIVPLGLVLNLFFKKLLYGHRFKVKKDSFWIPYPKTRYDLTFAQKQ